MQSVGIDLQQPRLAVVRSAGKSTFYRASSLNLLILEALGDFLVTSKSRSLEIRSEDFHIMYLHKCNAPTGSVAS